MKNNSFIIGIAVGVAVGVALHNLAVGVAIGSGIAFAFNGDQDCFKKAFVRIRRK
ncbi:hypothetical protein [Mucilaginibacter pallidiroseus]|uniref:hypothetical protein n=1 Tax=Mucilaginibacter pallidiroseus TaxID=2599295 RepID=UPI0016484B12|nr:hypothetical protein [Mucilaginibacter pallidiroseus]